MTSHNNVVPESDIRAILTAMDNKLNQSCVTCESPSQRNLYQNASSSIRTNLMKVVQVLPDEDYGEYMRSTTSSTTSSIDDESDDDNMSRMDDDELFDMQALERARVLRNQVRETAARLSILQKDTLSKVIDMTTAHQVMFRSETTMPMTNQKEQRDDPTTMPQCYERITQVWQELVMALEVMEQKLPSSVELFQSTVATIQQGLGGGLSRTEQAIVSRDNEGKKATAYLEEVGDVMTGEERLARFLGHY